LRLERASLHRQHGDLAEALADTEEALRLHPDWPPVLQQQARILVDQHDYPSALSAADSCLQLDPDNADARVIRARCQAALGDTNAAIHDLDQVLAGPERPLPDLYLERARWQAGLGDLKGAVQGLDAGMTRLGSTPSLALTAFGYERQSGDFDAALHRLETLQRFLPHETCLTIKGEVLVEAGRVSEAKAAFSEALRCLADSGSTSFRWPPQQVERLKTRALAGLENAAEVSE